MKIYKSVGHGGYIEIRDAFGNKVARFEADTNGRECYRMFCRGIDRDTELWDADYGRMMIGPIGLMDVSIGKV